MALIWVGPALSFCSHIACFSQVSPHWNISGAEDAAAALQELSTNGMIDDRTAAVVTGMLIYNANLKLMGTLKIVFAISPTAQVGP